VSDAADCDGHVAALGRHDFGWCGARSAVLTGDPYGQQGNGGSDGKTNGDLSSRDHHGDRR